MRRGARSLSGLADQLLDMDGSVNREVSLGVPAPE
jgi:hypothetical protein